ncbi:beta-D-galactosyl-(1-_4)-L-rhamnose phosphorylase [Lachnospiraceae bacterium PF1-22]
MMNTRKDFTLPGESGYEKLTLELAEKWGADTIRDSDGTQLSDELLNAGYKIYSTVCVIRDHNDWAKKNMDKLQQTFLIAGPVIAESDTVKIDLLEGYFADQFQINDAIESIKYWQVFDRTLNEEVDSKNWVYHKETGEVAVSKCIPWHKYSVNFLAYRVWEEISMYNHVTNNWDKEHLMQIDPVYPETQDYLLSWLETWCREHPHTDVVRFTSLFYNFVWMWGSESDNRNLFTDWGSYDFTVSPLALKRFEDEYGYRLISEDFVNQGKFQVTHMPPNNKKRDWMKFIHSFVIRFGKKLVDIVHRYDKLAYVFYDDSWIGLEPFFGRFEEFGFDGIIKCVFSGYEVRMCANVPVKTHEIRLHPYLFPVGLGGKPTFMEGGTPTLDAKVYWRNVRRALLRQPVERIGLGGYLHLTQGFPDFSEYITEISDEFRMIKALHEDEKPYSIATKVAILNSWGSIRPWTLSGHFHESDCHDLIHVIEALSGMPVDVSFIDFQDVHDQKIEKYDVIINAGREGDAWSGGEVWKKEDVVTNLTAWVAKGGTFLGVGEPSATAGFDTRLRMAHVLGIDLDRGERVNHGKWQVVKTELGDIHPSEVNLCKKSDAYIYEKATKVFLADNEEIIGAMHQFGKGQGIYLSEFLHTPENDKLLLDLILFVGKERRESSYLSNNPYIETVFFPKKNTLVAINNSEKEESTSIRVNEMVVDIRLKEFETKIVKM